MSTIAVRTWNRLNLRFAWLKGTLDFVGTTAGVIVALLLVKTLFSIQA